MLSGLFRWILLPLASLLLAMAGIVTCVGEGVTGERHLRGTIAAEPVPAGVVSGRAETRRAGATSLGAQTDTQILFGDLHVHTTYSSDAFAFSLPLFQGEGVHPPADACDFARHCAELDFWSINDHAESLTPWQWSETREAIRECNAVAGDPSNPDLVSFLGWEWTQSSFEDGPDPRTHWGHKNVLLLETADDATPNRPIGSGSGSLFGGTDQVPGVVWNVLRTALAMGDLTEPRPYLDFNRFLRDVSALETCPKGVPVRELPADCLEGAETPAELFEKLDDWGGRSLVIPHGTSWGIHAPTTANLRNQLEPGQHDPDRQRLFEVYSGHGLSEGMPDMVDVLIDEATGERQCAPPQPGYLPCCWQAGELIRARCNGVSDEVCEERVQRARATTLELPNPYAVVPGARPDDWLDCGQPRETFSAFEYRPNMSAQYGLATRNPDEGPEKGAFRFGLIGSSDNHKARPGPSYKEVGRKAFGDAYGFRDDWYDRLYPEVAPTPEPQETAGWGTALVSLERGASFYYTAGLVAAHASGRDRTSIFDALERREAYATSGPRILLWFDAQDEAGATHPMGSELFTEQAPVFTVRALGAFEQKPGCPDHTREHLSPERLQRLCLGECYHPSDRRIPIERIEVVRIRPQVTGDEPVEERIDDPWQSFPCPASGAGCQVSFEDPDYEGTSEVLYYARALQIPTDAINGDPVRCERDAAGQCLRARGCPAGGPDFDPDDECLAPVNERAWSSPIWVRSPDSRF